MSKRKYTALGLVMDPHTPVAKHPIPGPNQSVIVPKSSGGMSMGCSVLSGVSLPTGTQIQLSGSSNSHDEGIFIVVDSLSSGPLTTTKAAPKTKAPVNALDAAHALTSKKIHSGSIRRHRRSLRILDHGPRWKEQRCHERFKVVRWIGPNPREWEKIGWKVGPTEFPNRRAASRAKKELEQVAEVMDS